MSSEQPSINQFKTQKIIDTNITHKVDINNLMSRVREEEKRKKNENLVFLSLIGSVLVVTGLIASL